jgi:hypothetical protein
MVIRNIREHVAAHNWFAVAVDVGIVVLGVFLGTQVSNWNSERLDTRRADSYRLRLVDELDFNTRQYDLQNSYYLQAKAYGLAALSDLDGTKRLSDNEFLIAAYQLTQTDSTKAKTGVFNEVTANGLVDLLGDPEALQAGSDFYLTAEVVQRIIEINLPYRTVLREAMPYGVQMKIRTECGDRSVYYGKRLVGIRLVVPCPLQLEPAEAAEAARAVRSTPDLKPQMTRYIASLDEKLVNLVLARDQANAFREKLAASSRPSPA